MSEMKTHKQSLVLTGLSDEKVQGDSTSILLELLLSPPQKTCTVLFANKGIVLGGSVLEQCRTVLLL